MLEVLLYEKTKNGPILFFVVDKIANENLKCVEDTKPSRAMIKPNATNESSTHL